MAKLSYRYGAMNSGKTTALIQVAYNYEERNQRVIILKPKIDAKGNDHIVSRVGLTRKVDFLINEFEDIRKVISNVKDGISAILVDETQFLTKEQIEQLWMIAKLDNIPVICYGIRNDFKTNGFIGSIRLFELADELLELSTICTCGKKARFIGRKVNGNYVYEGSQVLIDGTDNVEYISLCGECYIRKVIKERGERV